MYLVSIGSFYVQCLTISRCKTTTTNPYTTITNQPNAITFVTLSWFCAILTLIITRSTRKLCLETLCKIGRRREARHIGDLANSILLL